MHLSELHYIPLPLPLFSVLAMLLFLVAVLLQVSDLPAMPAADLG